MQKDLSNSEYLLASGHIRAAIERLKVLVDKEKDPLWCYNPEVLMGVFDELIMAHRRMARGSVLRDQEIEKEKAKKVVFPETP